MVYIENEHFPCVTKICFFADFVHEFQILCPGLSVNFCFPKFCYTTASKKLFESFFRRNLRFSSFPGSKNIVFSIFGGRNWISQIFDIGHLQKFNFRAQIIKNKFLRGPKMLEGVFQYGKKGKKPPVICSITHKSPKQVFVDNLGH